MNNTRCPESGCELLLEEHLELHRLLDEIRELVAAKESPFDDLLPRLARIRALLVAHFEHEEAEGYFSDVIRVAPHYKPLVDSLCSEHPELHETLQTLIQDAEQLPGSTDCWAHVDRQFRTFFLQLSRHESKENRMVQQAYNRDIGTSE